MFVCLFVFIFFFIRCTHPLLLLQVCAQTWYTPLAHKQTFLTYI